MWCLTSGAPCFFFSRGSPYFLSPFPLLGSYDDFFEFVLPLRSSGRSYILSDPSANSPFPRFLTVGVFRLQVFRFTFISPVHDHSMVLSTPSRGDIQIGVSLSFKTTLAVIVLYEAFPLFNSSPPPPNTKKRCLPPSKLFVSRYFPSWRGLMYCSFLLEVEMSIFPRSSLLRDFL